MKKKAIIASVALGVACTIALTGCGNASSPAGASRAATRLAKRTDTVTGKMDKYEDKNYNFPHAFGNDFFIKPSPEVDEFQFHNPEFNKMKENRNKFPLSKKKTNTDAKASDATYYPRHFERKSLNMRNASRQEYLNRLDDLYALCADISAANARQNQLINEIKQEGAIMRELSSELKGKSRKPKTDWTEFNKSKDKAEKNLTKLYRDRNKLGKGIRMIPKANKNINPEAMQMRYHVIMNKLDSRLEKLETTKESMVMVNNSMRKKLGKSEENYVKLSRFQEINRLAPQTQNQENASLNSKIETETSNSHLNKLPTEHKQNLPIKQSGTWENESGPEAHVNNNSVHLIGDMQPQPHESEKEQVRTQRPIKHFRTRTRPYTSRHQESDKDIVLHYPPSYAQEQNQTPKTEISNHGQMPTSKIPHNPNSRFTTFSTPVDNINIKETTNNRLSTICANMQQQQFAQTPHEHTDAPNNSSKVEEIPQKTTHLPHHIMESEAVGS